MLCFDYYQGNSANPTHKALEAHCSVLSVVGDSTERVRVLAKETLRRNPMTLGISNFESLMVVISQVNPHLPASNASDGADSATNRYRVSFLINKSFKNSRYTAKREMIIYYTLVASSRHL